ncbi:glycosyltransferase family 2 protein [Cognatishimia sp. SS12]|uniref:glycosyltransferase family 2 protein n=1 Tax=Cognatishimia sp. SS12 TaxID=2979465 RepID=UPI00233027E8|nr:glycosyltransferase family 2 protein [Cognatishimia sp. SS12]MDC0739239.1 glycosyltransferase family 2 protein [Cognatishimia sp. SS12]
MPEISVGAQTKAPKITVVTSMKDEGPYILDWVSHYLALGVSDFVIFTNDCSDQTDHILRCLNRMGIVHHRFNRVMRRGPQKSALMWAEYEPAVRNANWLMVIDVDEYLQINTGDKTLPGLIRRHPEADAISFVWRIYGNADVAHLDQAPVPLGFTLTEHENSTAEDNRFFKTLFRNSSKFVRMGVHRPFLSETARDLHWVLPDGQRLTEEQIQSALFVSESYGYGAAQLNHYALRSMDSMLNKRLRGRANHHQKRHRRCLLEAL